MSRLRLTGFLLLLFVALPAGATPRPDTLELRSRAGSLGQLPRIVMDDGSAYVSAERLAVLLRGTWTAKGGRAALTVGKRSAEFVRNLSRTVIAGQSLALEAPVRVGAGGWLIPEEFLGKPLARLTPGIIAVTVAETKRPPAKPSGIALNEMRFRSYPSFTRVVVETAATLPYAVATSGSEVRVQLTRLTLGAVRSQEIADGLVKEIRLEPVAGGDAVLRVSLETSAADVKATTLQDPFRVVLDIYRPRESEDHERNQPALEPLRLIVLDAGHGGHDPGATGPSGLMEKDVVLDVTKRVSRMVEDGLNVKVAMTRSTDVFVPLRERTNFANKQRADLFVSIHANAHPQAISEGVEVYFLSSEASDSAARHVAAIENGVVQLESPALRRKGEVLKSILWDLAQSEFQQESSFMAETVLDSMTRSLRLVPRGVKQAGFYVLGGAAMPAILIEIGFLTNRKEEQQLAMSEHREAVARAIYAGLAEYNRRHDQRVRTARALPVRAERVR
jgi:N-acetylmuramoyl-L-alanine amidase